VIFAVLDVSLAVNLCINRGFFTFITCIGDYSPAHRLNVNVLLSNITFFVIFAVLDVSFAVNSCLNRSFFTFMFAVLLHF